MKHAITAALVLCAMFLFASLSYAQTSDKLSQLASDFCSQIGRGQTASDKTAQAAADFCAELNRAQTGREPIQLAMARSDQPIILAQASGQPAEKPRPAPRLIDGMPDDLHLSIGFRAWFNNWLNGKFFAGSGACAKCIVQLDDSSVGYIPTIGVRYKDFFVSASGMLGAHYTNKNTSCCPHSSRQEVDVNAGYYIHPSIALSLGYKGVFQQFKGTPAFPPTDHVNYNGPTLGISANVPIPEGGLLPSGFSVYGSGGGGYMWATQSSCCSISNHAWYGAMEGGLAYKLDTLVPVPLVFTAGYKYQILWTTFRHKFGTFGESHSQDVTRGPIIGVTALVF